ncbi:Glycolate dehydrogenase, iron-sulfur subunit GlcF [hydrothermal vent metagenome]|uniref:Glycolate dehydrogenase, iron-sulfur subunit GlcF n=1 Tax=hydrothermal vent metagenome TaxID=652676 RepID=A0A3B0ZXH4_9ZZZZ
MNAKTNPIEHKESIKKELDRCVMCGLCSDHCPTYKITGVEAESPRGRLALMNGLWNKELEADTPLLKHLDHCLGCRACEAVCPSQVNYGHLLDQTRAHLNATSDKNKNKMALRAMNLIAQGGSTIRLFFRLLWLTQRLKLPVIARKMGLLRVLKLDRLEGYLPSLQPRPKWKAVYYPKNECVGRVGLFLGCVAQEVDSQTLSASIRLLTKLGYEVHIPRMQNCCGALHLHAGYAEHADDLAQKNHHSFSQSGIQTIVSVASGCTTTLADSMNTINKKEGHADDTFRIKDINHFLLTENRLTSDLFAPLAQNIAIHDPCSLRQILKQQQAPYELLKLIPEVRISELPGNQYCCGAAGTHMITYPEKADLLRSSKIQALSNTQIIATSNIGCALHLAAGLRSRQNPIEVLHPVTILERQLRL